MSSSFSYSVPNNDFAKYLIGRWKRSLKCQYFGPSLPFVGGNNSVLIIEEETEAISEPGTLFLNWKVMKSGDSTAEDAKVAFCMQVFPNSDGSSNMQWEYHGHNCEGFFHPQASSATLMFKDDAGTMTVVNRAVDENTMAVCIVEVDNQFMPVMQFGTMARIVQ
mmetsp:Transcript_4158/g.6344  ORF Transcript_4158/g.6344 Transcript_4158/m.6344 type:complete len:164 (+) Transcript_4158:102-593(+)